MCFSQEASFAGGIMISAFGIATIAKVQKPSYIVFACIPLFFGLQQITEGFVWLSMENHEYEWIRKSTVYIYLVMAEVLWPIIIPLSVLFMEEDARKKKTLWLLLAAGGSLSLYYASCLVLFEVNPQIISYHIQYNTTFPGAYTISAFFVYLTSTIVPLFVSSIKHTHLLGTLMALSCLVTTIFFTQYLISVWCFFGALLSVVIYWILDDSKKTFNLALLKELLPLDKPDVKQSGSQVS